MWITITISRSVISDGLLWPRCRHTHSAMRLCGPVLLTCSSCFLCSLLYTFHAERPRHRLEADTTWNTTHQIKCSHHTGFDHSSVLLYYNAEHYQLTCTFLNLLILPLGTVQILRPCMHSEVHSFFTKYCHWTIFWTIWIRSAPTHFVFKISFDVNLPCMYLVSYKLTLLMHL